MEKILSMLAGFVFLTVFFAGAVIAGEKNVVTYEKDVNEIIAKRCLACHGPASPTIGEFKKDEAGFKKKMKGPRMDSYSNLMTFVNGSDTGALMRRLDDGKNTKGGKPGNMNRYLGGTESERAKNLEVIKNWVGGWSLKKKKEITKDELKAINALEK